MLGGVGGGGGGRGEDVYMEQEHPPAAVDNAGRDEEATSDSPPTTTTPFLSASLPVVPLASSEKKKKKNHNQQHEHGDLITMTSLPSDVLVEILSRVPHRSLCRLKCVSRSWLTFFSDPDIRRRLPLTLSGFFLYKFNGSRFRNLSGRGPPLVDPSLPFLRRTYKETFIAQCCHGLLLCRCWRSPKFEQGNYVVCDPATQEWTALPPIESPDGTVHQPLDYSSGIFLGFDPAVPSRFAVVALLSNCHDKFKTVAIYSTETGGRWSCVQSQWDPETTLVDDKCVLLNGTMHLMTHCSSVVTVDMEGKVWREIKTPFRIASHEGFASIGLSQGRLHAWNIDFRDWQLSVWVLEDYGGVDWTLKHTVNVLELFGRERRHRYNKRYTMFAIHPECDLVFLTDKEEKTMAYDMDSQKVHVMSTSGEFLGGKAYFPSFTDIVVRIWSLKASCT